MSTTLLKTGPTSLNAWPDGSFAINCTSMANARTPPLVSSTTFRSVTAYAITFGRSQPANLALAAGTAEGLIV